MLESELFGYEKGAFTGATERRIGRLESAQGGTLFLNGVGKIPRYLQAKLFNLLDYGEITRLGAARPIKLDVRILAASSEDLEAYVHQDKMMPEFYYRINVLSLHIPLYAKEKKTSPHWRSFLWKSMAAKVRSKDYRMPPYVGWSSTIIQVTCESWNILSLERW